MAVEKAGWGDWAEKLRDAVGKKEGSEQPSQNKPQNQGSQQNSQKQLQNQGSQQQSQKQEPAYHYQHYSEQRCEAFLCCYCFKELKVMLLLQNVMTVVIVLL